MPEPVTFFVDRCLGHPSAAAGCRVSLVGERLKEAGLLAELHDDHFEPDAPDVAWLPVVAGRGWVILTKDKRIRRRAHELEALVQANARVFVLGSGHALQAEEMAQVFIVNQHRMLRLIRKQLPPFVAGVYQDRVALLYPQPPEEPEED